MPIDVLYMKREITADPPNKSQAKSGPHTELKLS